MPRRWSIYIGFDARESDAFAVARESIRKHLNTPIPIYGLVLEDMRKAGLYWRPTEKRLSAADPPVLWDVISEHPMATEFAISRFLVPHLAKEGLALFVDADVMARGCVAWLFEKAENLDDKAVWCVQHKHQQSAGLKMDNQVQSAYGRKNWSSVMLWNCDHAGAKKLTPEYVNSVPGRDLHQFKFLADDEIGELGPEWNHLVGEYAPNPDAKLVHFTLGHPAMAGYENSEFGDEWRAERDRWARGSLRFSV
jgi:hypothetical protein